MFLHGENRCVVRCCFRTYLLCCLMMRTDVFSNAEHFDSPLRILIKTFYTSNSKHSTQNKHNMSLNKHFTNSVHSTMNTNTVCHFKKCNICFRYSNGFMNLALTTEVRDVSMQNFHIDSLTHLSPLNWKTDRSKIKFFFLESLSLQCELFLGTECQSSFYLFPSRTDFISCRPNPVKLSPCVKKKKTHTQILKTKPS